MTPLLVHGQSEPPAMATHNRAGKGSRRRSRSHKAKQSNDKDQGHKDQIGVAGSPARTLAGAASAAPARPLPGQLAPTPTERATLEPMASNTIFLR